MQPEYIDPAVLTDSSRLTGPRDHDSLVPNTNVPELRSDGMGEVSCSFPRWPGNLDEMTEHWNDDEKRLGYRLVKLARAQKSNTTTFTCSSATPGQRDPNCVYFSCVWWQDKGQYYAATAEMIRLVESFGRGKFTTKARRRMVVRWKCRSHPASEVFKYQEPDFYKVMRGIPGIRSTLRRPAVWVIPWDEVAGELELLADDLQSVMNEPSLEPSQDFGRIVTHKGASITPILGPASSEGFFLSGDGNCTCYRRNNLSIQCQYSLDPYPSDKELFLEIDGGRHRINGLAVTLSARMEANGKIIGLTQDAPDRTANSPIKMVKLLPRAPEGFRNDRSDTTAWSMPVVVPPCLAFQSVELSASEENCNVGVANSPDEHIFERVHFASATPNNDRRKRQHFYRLNVELFADIRSSGDDNPVWKMLAQRSSRLIVVRGRSPLHYSQADRGGSDCDAFTGDATPDERSPTTTSAQQG